MPPALLTAAGAAADRGQEAIYLVRDGKALAVCAVVDAIREEGREAFAALHERGIEVAMLTGDAQAVADAVAKELGIDTEFAEVLLEDKASKAQEVQAQGKKVARIGDGDAFLGDRPRVALEPSCRPGVPIHLPFRQDFKGIAEMTCESRVLWGTNRVLGVITDIDGQCAFETNAEDGTVSVIDLASREIVASVATGAYPHQLRLSPDGGVKEQVASAINPDHVGFRNSRSIVIVSCGYLALSLFLQPIRRDQPRRTVFQE